MKTNEELARETARKVTQKQDTTEETYYKLSINEAHILSALAAATEPLQKEIERMTKRVTETERHSLQLRQEAADANTTLTQMRINEDAWLLERDALRAEVKELRKQLEDRT